MEEDDAKTQMSVEVDGEADDGIKTQKLLVREEAIRQVLNLCAE
jgi:hypothetical protein